MQLKYASSSAFSQISLACGSNSASKGIWAIVIGGGGNHEKVTRSI